MLFWWVKSSDRLPIEMLLSNDEQVKRRTRPRKTNAVLAVLWFATVCYLLQHQQGKQQKQRKRKNKQPNNRKEKTHAQKKSARHTPAHTHASPPRRFPSFSYVRTNYTRVAAREQLNVPPCVCVCAVMPASLRYERALVSHMGCVRRRG